MKNKKSLTILFLAMLVSACTGHSSAAFSSSNGGDSNSSSHKTYEHCYDGYYDSLVSWTNGEDLKNQLNAIIRNGYTALSYSGNFDSNVNADHSMYDFEYLDVIYSSTNSYKTDTNKGWQREHAWCASLMCGTTTTDAVKQKGRATDFHNLFAAEAGGNQSRGNKNYGVADKTAANYTNRTTSNGQDGYSFATEFEPGNIDKGRLARAIFYMATMYKDAEEDVANGVTMGGLTIVNDPVNYVAGDDCHFAIGNLNDLLSWNNSYAVDFLEMQHNVSVYTNANNPDGFAQGNRNPYVDYPGLVDYVYGSKKNQPGTLAELIPSCSYLNSDEDTLSHYALKEAKRDYSLGATVQRSDYVIAAVNKDYSYTVSNESFTHSLANHVFSDSDGDSITATITTGINTITYVISLNPMASCSTGVITLNKSTINDKSPNTEQLISFGSYQFYFKFTTSYSDVSSSGMTLRDDNQNGGFYLGSSNKTLTSLTLKSKESYTVDQAYIKACANNKDSSYKLVIKVGDQVLLDQATVNYNSQKPKCYGSSSRTPLTGQITYIFTGSNALRLNSIAFNEIIA